MHNSALNRIKLDKINHIVIGQTMNKMNYG